MNKTLQDGLGTPALNFLRQQRGLSPQSINNRAVSANQYDRKLLNIHVMPKQSLLMARKSTQYLHLQQQQSEHSVWRDNISVRPSSTHQSNYQRDASSQYLTAIRINSTKTVQRFQSQQPTKAVQETEKLELVEENSKITHVEQKVENTDEKTDVRRSVRSSGGLLSKISQDIAKALRQKSQT